MPPVTAGGVAEAVESTVGLDTPQHGRAATAGGRLPEKAAAIAETREEDYSFAERGIQGKFSPKARRKFRDHSDRIPPEGHAQVESGERDDPDRGNKRREEAGGRSS